MVSRERSASTTQAHGNCSTAAPQGSRPRAAAGFSLLRFFYVGALPVKVLGDSMMPNYHDGSRHFINKFAYYSDKPERGDVVGVRSPTGDTYIKRIIGLPGEHLTFEDGVVAVNGQLLREPYIETKVPWRVLPRTWGRKNTLSWATTARCPSPSSCRGGESSAK